MSIEIHAEAACLLKLGRKFTPQKVKFLEAIQVRLCHKDVLSKPFANSVDIMYLATEVDHLIRDNLVY